MTLSSIATDLHRLLEQASVPHASILTLGALNFSLDKGPGKGKSGTVQMLLKSGVVMFSGGL